MPFVGVELLHKRTPQNNGSLYRSLKHPAILDLRSSRVLIVKIAKQEPAHGPICEVRLRLFPSDSEGIVLGQGPTGQGPTVSFKALRLSGLWGLGFY